MLFFEGVPLWHASVSAGRPFRNADRGLLMEAIALVFQNVGEQGTDIEQDGRNALHVRRRTRPEERDYIRPRPERPDLTGASRK